MGRSRSVRTDPIATPMRTFAFDFDEKLQIPEDVRAAANCPSESKSNPKSVVGAWPIGVNSTSADVTGLPRG